MSEPVRWGFLGAGTVARVALAPAVRAADGAVLQAVAARDLDRARSLAPAGAAYGSYDALLADPSVDAVYVSLANDAHAPWSIAALEAGTHVLCEKPFAMNAAQVARMAAAAQRGDRLLVEAMWSRWHPRTRRAVSLLRDGAVGAVRHVTAGFTFAGALEGNFRLEVERGGGALYDVGCYAVAAALWAFGTPLRQVVAWQRLGPTGVDLATDAVLTFDGGDAEVHVAVDETERQWLRVAADGGEVELRAPSYSAWVEDEAQLCVSDGSGTQRERFPPVDPYLLMVEAVSRRIGGEDAWVLPLAESMATMSALDACFASARGGGEPVRLS